MTWFMEILMICPEEQLLINYKAFLIKNLLELILDVMMLKVKLYQAKN